MGPHLIPSVIVARMAANIDHPVDRRRATNNPPARGNQPAPAQMRLWLGGKSPIVDRHVHRVGQGGRHLDEGAHIGAALFDDQNLFARFAQPVSQR